MTHVVSLSLARAGHIQKYNRRERSKDETLEALSRLFDNTQRDLFDQFVAMVNQ